MARQKNKEFIKLKKAIKIEKETEKSIMFFIDGFPQCVLKQDVQINKNKITHVVKYIID